MKTKDLTICAMLAAMCAVLGYVSIDTGNIKISFESLPIVLGALLFGPVSGCLIGTTGTFVYQLLRYGVSLTTALWILPYSLCGFLTGWISKKNQFSLSKKKMFITILANELLITLLNTFAIYVDSKIYGWYYPMLILGSLAIRLIIAIIKGFAFAEILNFILKPVKKALQS